MGRKPKPHWAPLLHAVVDFDRDSACASFWRAPVGRGCVKTQNTSIDLDLKRVHGF